MNTSSGEHSSPERVTDALVQDVRDLGCLAIKMARIERATAYPDGTRENDAEHSFMLALVARSLAAEFCPELNPDKVAWYATIHDLLESITGDICTLMATPETYVAKEQAEALALQEFRRRYARAWPSLVEDLEKYEAQQEPETRFIKVIDKVLPAICELEDDGRRLYERGVHSADDHMSALRAMDSKLLRVAPDQTFALALRQAFIVQVRREVFGATKTVL